MSVTVRLGVLGGARHAGVYLPLLRTDPRVELVALAEEPGVPGWMLADSRAVAGRFGLPFEEGSHGLLDPARVDAVLVCSEPARHARLAIEALRAGLHVIVDKPVATTLADAQAVAKTAASASRSCTVVNRTHAASLRRTRSWIDSGQLGIPLHVDYECLASGAHFASSVERPELVLDPALAGGGELLNFGGYGVDAVRYLTGLDVVSVQAFAGALFDLGHADAGLEDVALVSLGLARGVTATLTVGRVPWAPGPGASLNSFRVVGSHGHATGDDNAPAVLRYGPEGVGALPQPGATGSDIVGAFFDHVVGRLLVGAAPEYTAADALISAEVVAAAYRSVREGVPVALG